MKPCEYIALVQDLVDEMERKMQPHVARLHQRVLDAEAAYANTLSEPDPRAAYIASRDDGSGTMATLASYMEKWREQDALQKCEAECAAAAREYNEAVAPLQAEHERRVQERLDARRNNLHHS